MNEYLMIIKDIFEGMFRPKKCFQSIYERELSMKPLFVVVSIMGGLSLISMVRIQNSAISINSGELPLYILNNYENFELILSSDLSNMIMQVIYSLLITQLISTCLLKLLVWVMKAEIEFKKCLILVCYSWGPNILASFLLTVLVLFMPVEKTMFAQGLFEIILGSSSLVYKCFRIVDPFYVWSIIVLVCYLGLFPSKSKNKKWHYWAFAVYLIPFLVNLMYLVS